MDMHKARSEICSCICFLCVFSIHVLTHGFFCILDKFDMAACLIFHPLSSIYFSEMQYSSVSHQYISSVSIERGMIHIGRLQSYGWSVYTKSHHQASCFISPAQVVWTNQHPVTGNCWTFFRLIKDGGQVCAFESIYRAL